LSGDIKVGKNPSLLKMSTFLATFLSGTLKKTNELNGQRRKLRILVNEVLVKEITFCWKVNLTDEVTRMEKGLHNELKCLFLNS
jgi:hypothetical protein